MKKFLTNVSPELVGMLETAGRRRYNPGQEILLEGSKAKFLPIVVSGRVKMIRSPAVGKEIIIGYFRDAEMFAVPPVFDGGVYPASAYAMRDSELLLVPREEVLRIFAESAEFAFEIMAWMCEMIREKNAIIRNLAIQSSKLRVANVILKLVEERSGNLPVTITVRRQDIAEMASVTTETAIRIIRRLAQSGIFRIEHGKIIVDDVDPLIACLRS